MGVLSPSRIFQRMSSRTRRRPREGPYVSGYYRCRKREPLLGADVNMLVLAGDRADGSAS